jgi:hypothetical protein
MYTELGVLDEAEVRSTFERVWRGAMTNCQKRSNEFVSGLTVVRMRVNHQGQVKWVYFKETVLGDRQAEKCMLDALRSASWPTPQGGEDGLAEQELAFADLADRPATEWDPARVQPALAKALEPLQECRAGVNGLFTATAVVKTDGSVRSVGIAPPDETGEQAADCIVDVIKGLTFPTTGSWPAKVTFDVP